MGGGGGGGEWRARERGRKGLCSNPTHLASLWLVQVDKNPVQVENVHSILTAAACRFTPQHLDHLFHLIQQVRGEGREGRREGRREGGERGREGREGREGGREAVREGGGRGGREIWCSIL